MNVAAEETAGGPGGLAASLGPGLDPVVGAAGAGTAPAAGKGKVKRLSRSAVAWAVYEGARDPYVILVTIYIFAPYFSTAVVGDPVRGQSLVADIAMIAGLIVAATAPLLGASIDGMGRRKPMLLLMTALMIPMLCALWWVKPAGAGLGIGFASLILGALAVVFAYSELIHNSMLVRAAAPAEAPYASGLALSLGNFMSVFMLVFVLWGFALPGHVSWSFIPARPLFGLSQVLREPDRLVGPIVATIFAVFAVPIFLFTPDAPASGVPMTRALAAGASGLRETFRSLRRNRPAAVFLGSRMLYTDGMTALLVFTGVFAAGVMGWKTLDLLAYGIILSVCGVLGGQIAARLDAAIGPKHAIQIEITAAAACLFCTLGMGKERVLYMPYDLAAHPRIWNGPIFTTLPQIVFLMIGCVSAVFVTGQYASSRTFLTRLAPPGRSASFFGLYALSGTVTMWLGSMLVSVFTGLFHTQQAGFAPIAMLLTVGLIGMAFVREGPSSASSA